MVGLRPTCPAGSLFDGRPPADLSGWLPGGRAAGCDPATASCGPKRPARCRSLCAQERGPSSAVAFQLPA